MATPNVDKPHPNTPKVLQSPPKVPSAGDTSYLNHNNMSMSLYPPSPASWGKNAHPLSLGKTNGCLISISAKAGAYEEQVKLVSQQLPFFLSTGAMVS